MDSVSGSGQHHGYFCPPVIAIDAGERVLMGIIRREETDRRRNSPVLALLSVEVLDVESGLLTERDTTRISTRDAAA
jgi:hypothetical protein